MLKIFWLLQVTVLTKMVKGKWDNQNILVKLYWDVWTGCDDSHGKRSVTEGVAN